MYIAGIETDEKDVLNVDEKTTRFGLVISSLCSESLLDDLDAMFDKLNLSFSEKSELFEFEKNHYLQVHTTDDSHECLFNNLLPFVSLGEKGILELLNRIKHISGMGSSKIFHEHAIVDVDKLTAHLKVHPFSFDSGNSLVFDKPKIANARSDKEKLILFSETVGKLFSSGYGLELSCEFSGEESSSDFKITLILSKKGGLVKANIAAGEITDQVTTDALAKEVATWMVKEIAPYILMKKE